MGKIALREKASKREDAAPKKPRQDPTQLTDMRRGSYVSQSAMEVTLDNVRDRGMPTAPNRRTQLRARKTVAGRPTPFGPCVVDIDLPLETGPFTVAVSSPFATLYRLFMECPDFQVVLRDAFRKKKTLYHVSALEPRNILRRRLPFQPLQQGQRPTRHRMCILDIH